MIAEKDMNTNVGIRIRFRKGSCSSTKARKWLTIIP